MSASDRELISGPPVNTSLFLTLPKSVPDHWRSQFDTRVAVGGSKPEIPCVASRGAAAIFVLGAYRSHGREALLESSVRTAFQERKKQGVISTSRCNTIP